MIRIFVVVVISLCMVNSSFSQYKSSIIKLGAKINTDIANQAGTDVNSINAGSVLDSEMNSPSPDFENSKLNMESFEQFKNEFSSLELATVKEKYREKVKPWLKDLKVNRSFA